MELTAEQQAIVQHGRGPALVFAVAGAGKTTTMVRRIERLVSEKTFSASNILATTFGRAAREDILRALTPYPHCARVNVLTLHQVGLRLVRSAQREGAPWLQGGGQENENVERLLLARTLALARARDVDYRTELEGLDWDDFLSYVSACKGNLAFADLAKAALPEAARVASQAQAPVNLPWYLDLYRLFEEARARDGFLTFDDMLLSGWEALVRSPRVLGEAQALYRCVLVDEFQDVNLAQAEILDAITAPTRDYMAIGDDDQTIYEWRGASPRFILGFAERYAATKYLITDNFRCQAQQLTLANRVIRQNSRREFKQLSLTRGFDGLTQVHLDDGPMTMGASVVKNIRDALDAGRPPAGIAVLVRLYAQTPYIERFLVEGGIKYRLIGARPFYARAENSQLLAYVRLALLDAQTQAGAPLSDPQAAAFGQLWPSIANRPLRYLTTEVQREVAAGVTVKGLRLARSLVVCVSAPKHAQRSLAELSELIDWLANVLDRPAALILGELERKLGFCTFLRQSSGFHETGEGRAQNVLALVQFAGSNRSLRQFMLDLDVMSAARASEDLEHDDAVNLLSIHRAKGLEWPVVIIPGLNAGTFPLAGAENLEEERRLLYVAITRSRGVLHLHVRRDEPPSPFLSEVEASADILEVTRLAGAIAADPAEWNALQALAAARSVRTLGLQRYFLNWWPFTPERRGAMAARVMAFMAATTRRGLSESLSLTPHDQHFWESFAPNVSGAEDDFPDLESLIPAPAAPEPKAATLRPAAEADLGLGRRVRHPTLGDGEVVAQERQAGNLILTVVFSNSGRKRLLASAARLGVLD